MRITLSFIAIALGLTLTSIKCKDEPTQPSPEDKQTNCTYPAGNRNFLWRLDTVAWFPSTVGGVWAFSDTDAYVMGYIIDGRPPYALRAGRHWNGKIWEDNINGAYGFNNATQTWGDISIDPRNDVTGDDHFMVAVGFCGFVTTPNAGIAEFDNTKKKWKSYQLQAVGELRSVWTDGKGYFIAVGDNGMVYTKDGYTADWVYQKAPTEFNLVKVQGVSKGEVYFLGDKAIPGMHYQQVWRLLNGQYIKLFDNLDTTNTPIQFPSSSDDINSFAVIRCSISDSLYLYTIGDESYEFTGKGSSVSFNKINLASRGLPLSSLNKPGVNIRLSTPNDLWISSAWYYIYHWNGFSFQKIEPVPWFAYGQPWGVTSRIQRSGIGKTWLLIEMDSQIYSILQGELPLKVV